MTPEQTVGNQLYELGDRQWDIPALHKLLESILAQSKSFDAFAVEYNLPVIGKSEILLNARRVAVETEEMILLAFRYGASKETS